MRRGSVSFFLAVLFAAGGPVGAETPDGPPPGACSSPEYRQFDFWLGDWNVQDAAGNLAGTNQITSTQGGCVLFENWKGAKKGTGNSFNMFLAADGKWHQTWVDNQGGRLDLAGGLQDGRMVLEGDAPSSKEAGKRVKHRITWEKKGANVRQVWQSSRDDGKTWDVVFDGLYVPKKAK